MDKLDAFYFNKIYEDNKYSQLSKLLKEIEERALLGFWEHTPKYGLIDSTIDYLCDNNFEIKPDYKNNYLSIRWKNPKAEQAKKSLQHSQTFGNG